MNGDFSHLNLEYLIQARDLALENPRRAGAILGISDAMAGLLPELTPHFLASLTRVQHPLVIPRQDAGWWSRLLGALREGQSAEIEVVMAQTTLTLVSAEKEENR